MTKTTRPTTAFIWRQSIYENEFKCKCGWVVGKMVDMGETDLEPGLHGSWPEFEKKMQTKYGNYWEEENESIK